jgi:predicted TIM-barrel fold metal-dependent hydrolase
MPIIDAQVHAYERDHPGRPWAAVLQGPPEVTGDDMVAAMDAVGVDGALLISPFTMYRFDASDAIEVRARHPGRFGLIKPVDPSDPGVGETVADWAATPGTVGVRIMLNRGVSEDPGVLTYRQGVDAFRHTDRLSASDKRAPMGETLERVYRWSPTIG